jgi:hypothetical protein
MTTLSTALERPSNLEANLSEAATKEVLKRTLSVGTVISTGLSFAERMNADRHLSTDTTDYRDIGRGSCGSIFEIPGSANAIKKGANITSIWNDYVLTNVAHKSYITWAGLMQIKFPGLRVPRVPSAQLFHSPDSDDYWKANLHHFPKPDQTRAATFFVERILPVPLLTRQAIIGHFYETSQQAQTAEIRENSDCLVRIYLGKKHDMPHKYNSTDTLRNFPLYLNDAKLLDLPVTVYAEEMAIGLAILHWDAGIDAADTEFVIGNSINAQMKLDPVSLRSAPPPVSTAKDFGSRETQMWMLDYDKCSALNLSGAPPDVIVQKYLVAVTGNDPYYPNTQLDKALWGCFRAAYQKASSLINQFKEIEEDVAALPALVMDRWEEWAAENAKAEDDDPFDRVDEAGDEDGGWNSDNEADEDDDDDESSEDDSEDDIDFAEELPSGPISRRERRTALLT